MLNLWNYLGLMMCFVTFFFLISFSSNLLLIMISFEFIMVLVYSVYFDFLFFQEIESMKFMIYILILMVCESTLGLSLIIYMLRFYGNDYLNSLSLLKW